MKVANKTKIDNQTVVAQNIYFGIALIEGDINGITMCWVEKNGRMASNPGSIDKAEADYESMLEDAD